MGVHPPYVGLCTTKSRGQSEAAAEILDGADVFYYRYPASSADFYSPELCENFSVHPDHERRARELLARMPNPPEMAPERPKESPAEVALKTILVLLAGAAIALLGRPRR